MAGFDKVVTSYSEAMAGLEDGMTVIAGGFGLCGIPEGLIAQIKRYLYNFVMSCAGFVLYRHEK